MQLILLKSYNNSAGRPLPPGQVGDWSTDVAEKMIAEAGAMRYTPQLQKYCTGAIADLNELEKAGLLERPKKKKKEK